jgi:hypothetical protein
MKSEAQDDSNREEQASAVKEAKVLEDSTAEEKVFYVYIKR